MNTWKNQWEHNVSLISLNGIIKKYALIGISNP